MAAPQPLNEQFSDSYTQRATLKPSTGRIMPQRPEPAKNVQVDRQTSGTRRAASATIQASGVAMQAVGKTTKYSGRAVRVAGTALSSTGVGAVVGVPLAVVGGAAEVAGTGVDAAGKVTLRAGRRVMRAGRETEDAATKAGGTKKQNAGTGIKKGGLKGVTSNKLGKAAKGGFLFEMTLWTVFLTFFFPLACILTAVAAVADVQSNIALAVDNAATVQETDGAVTAAVKNVFRFFGRTIESFAKNVNEFINDVFGVDILGIFGSLLPTSIYSELQFAFGILITLLYLSIGVVLFFRGHNPLLGNNAKYKIPVFMVTFLLQIIPGLCIFPWFYAWYMTVKVSG